MDGGLTLRPFDSLRVVVSSVEARLADSLRGKIPVRCAFLLAAALAGCAAKTDNTIAVTNGWNDRCQVSVYETYAAHYQFLDLRAGEQGSFANLPKGTYHLAFTLYCGTATCGTAYEASRTVTFGSCCDTSTFAVGGDGAVAP